MVARFGSAARVAPTSSVFPAADLDEGLDIGDFLRHYGRGGSDQLSAVLVASRFGG